MQIVKKDLEERLTNLQKWHAKLVQDLAATDGAMQECEYWLSIVSQEEKEETNGSN